MATSKGVIQGYTGVALVDEAHQIIIEAQAHGTGSEQELLLSVVEAANDWRAPTTTLTADSGFHSEANLKALGEAEVDAYIADKDYRRRDVRFAGQAVHQAKPDPLHDKRPKEAKPKRFTPEDFHFDPCTQTCTCPAGKRLHGSGSNCTIGGYKAIQFQGAKRDCVPCQLRDHCLRTPEKTATRQVAFFQGKAEGLRPYTEHMKQRIDTDQGRDMIGRRFATVEPVFGNVRGNKRLDRFTLRGRAKVDGQWKLYSMVHNIEKLAHQGYAA